MGGRSETGFTGLANDTWLRVDATPYHDFPDFYNILFCGAPEWRHNGAYDESR